MAFQNPFHPASQSTPEVRKSFGLTLLEVKREVKLATASLFLPNPQALTNVCSQLFGGVWGHLWDLKDHITIGLHGGSGNGA